MFVPGHRKKHPLRSKSSSEVSETSLDTAYEEIAKPWNQSSSRLPEINEGGVSLQSSVSGEQEEKPTLPSRKPRLGQSSLTQTAVQPVISNTQSQV